MKEQTFYTMFGTKENATLEEIKKAYRKLMFQMHPDRNPNYNKEAFYKVQKAFEVLSNPQKRKAYDLWLQKRRNFAKRMKAESKNRKNTKTTKRTVIPKYEITVFLTLKELFSGKEMKIYYKGKNILVKIPAKSYVGRKNIYIANINGVETQIIVKTGLKKTGNERMNFLGNIYNTINIDSNLAYFGGKKTIITPTGEKVTINLKGNLRNAQVIKLSKMGAFNSKGERGDLYLSVNIKKVVFSFNAVKEAFSM